MRQARALAVYLLLLVLVVPAPAAKRKSLDDHIDDILKEPEAARAFWGIEIASLTSGKTLYSHHSDKLFIPASNTKLFTTAAALALIGPDHRFRTTIETTGTVDRHGRLTGDLVLVGRGDPNLSGRTLPYHLRTERKLPHVKVLDDLADQVAAKGIKYIEGDVVADDSYYAFERYAEGWAQDDLVWEWGAPVSALTINDNVIFVSVLPADRVGEKAFVSFDPFPDYYRIDNRVLTTPPGTGPRKIYITREPGSDRITLWGNIPSDDPGAGESLAIEDPADFAARLFRRMLERRGITVYGATRTRHTELASLSTFSVTTTASLGGGEGRATSPADVQALNPMRKIAPAVLAAYDSQPMMEDLRVINKVSQNLHAELMLRLLGREKGTAGTIEGGLEVLRGFLSEVGLTPEEYVFFDGSGLSRQNLATPGAVVKLLKHVDTQPWAPLFRETLPVAGVDGSLAERFKQSPARGRVQAKTGSLGHVNSLSGYATTVKGERIAFAIFSNNHNLPSRRAIAMIDRILEAAVDDARYKRKSK